MSHIQFKVNDAPFLLDEGLAENIFSRGVCFSGNGDIQIDGIGAFQNFPLTPTDAAKLISERDPLYLETIFNLKDFPIMGVISLKYEGMAHISQLPELIKAGLVKDQKTFNEYISPIH